MLTIILSLLFGLLLATGLHQGNVLGTLGSVLFGILCAVLVYGLAAWRLRRLLTRHMSVIQNIMLSGQKQLQTKVQQLQSKPSGNPKQMMQELEKYQKELIRRAMVATSALEPFRLWIPLMSRQIATLRMQFHYQLQEFDKVDALLPKCLMLEPISMAMRLAQRYRAKAELPEIRKLFDRSVARLKYNQGALLYSLMAWILLQHKQEDEAHSLLVEACKNTEHETIKRNRDRLANNRAREFSNAGLGDEWYALYLEQPKMQTRRQMPRADGRPF